MTTVLCDVWQMEWHKGTMADGIAMCAYYIEPTESVADVMLRYIYLTLGCRVLSCGCFYPYCFCGGFYGGWCCTYSCFFFILSLLSTKFGNFSFEGPPLCVPSPFLVIIGLNIQYNLCCVCVSVLNPLYSADRLW